MSEITEKEETQDNKSGEISDAKWTAIGAAALTVLFIWLAKTDIFYGHTNAISKAFVYWKQHWVHM